MLGGRFDDFELVERVNEEVADELSLHPSAPSLDRASRSLTTTPTLTSPSPLSLPTAATLAVGGAPSIPLLANATPATADAAATTTNRRRRSATSGNQRNVIQRRSSSLTFNENPAGAGEVNHNPAPHNRHRDMINDIDRGNTIAGGQMNRLSSLLNSRQRNAVHTTQMIQNLVSSVNGMDDSMAEHRTIANSVILQLLNTLSNPVDDVNDDNNN